MFFRRISLIITIIQFCLYANVMTRFLYKCLTRSMGILCRASENHFFILASVPFRERSNDISLGCNKLLSALSMGKSHTPKSTYD